ncbi:MAG TPA: DUF4382 domain-containing protein [Noviherbaspirillum sp.]
MKKTTLSLLAAASGAALVAACGGGGGGSGDVAYGTLGVSLTDAPACGFDKVYVTIDKVRAHQSGGAGENDGGWIDIPVELDDPKVDLLELSNGVLERLGDVRLPAGTYNQLRLVLKPNTGADPKANSVLAGGIETALDTPSAVQSGIKVNGSFEVTADATTELTLDFDACKSVVKHGNGSFGLKPVVTMVAMETSGAISGVLDPAIAATASNQPIVSAQVDGVVVKSTVPKANGEFSLAPLKAGTYTVVVTTAAHASDVIDAVPVTASGTTTISTSAAPLTMSASTANTVSGTVTPASAQAEITAHQTFASGTIASIDYRMVTGKYSLPLPIAAPRYGQYTGSLPVTLTAQPALAGKYSLRAAAEGYQEQTTSVDLAGGNATHNFTLPQ